MRMEYGIPSPYPYTDKENRKKLEERLKEIDEDKEYREYLKGLEMRRQKMLKKRGRPPRKRLPKPSWLGDGVTGEGEG